MKLLDLIESSPTWAVLDSSKLTTYMNCPRKYFYQYMLGWRPDYPNNHLVFGSAWHLAVEHLLLHGCSSHSVAEAALLFSAHYREYFPAETDELFEPKTLINAANALIAYAVKWHRDTIDYEVLHTEVGGLVSITAVDNMTFKMDAILRDRSTGAVFALDHKTSQRYNDDWGSHWTLSTQMLTYLHALYCFYPQSEGLKMLVRSTFFYNQNTRSPSGRKRHPKEFGFEEFPIEKSLAQMQSWLTRTVEWAERLTVDKEILLLEDNDEKTAMRSFPVNDTSCWSYGQKCVYYDFCNAWSNPLEHAEHPPIGFRIEHWNPLAAPEIREKVDLTHMLLPS